MIKKKSAFLTFWFSLLPGAGQMYMGFMKRGISLMASFFLLIFFSVWLNLSPLLFAMPIIWFFAFFDTHNLRSTPDDVFASFKDDYIFIPNLAKDFSNIVKGKYRNIIAIALIIIGTTILWNNIYDIMSYYLPEFVSYFIYKFGRTFPQLLIGFTIIAFGFILIRGKKRDLELNEIEQQSNNMGGMQ